MTRVPDVVSGFFTFLFVIYITTSLTDETILPVSRECLADLCYNWPNRKFYLLEMCKCGSMCVRLCVICVYIYIYIYIYECVYVFVCK